MPFSVAASDQGYRPPAQIAREQVIRMSEKVLTRPDLKTGTMEDIFRIHAAELDWDVGVMVYEPEDPAKIPVGADGKKAGLFLLHGGSGDYRKMERLACLLSAKFGYRVACMTYPGRLYLEGADRDWPGDTIHPDGSVRTPIWQKGEKITPDQYDVVQDASLRERYGTLIQAKARPGTLFYYRMAAWPLAFEAAMKEVCRRHFPENEYSIYVHGHSTGGPYVHYLTQRVANIAGVIGIENTPFGYIMSAMIGQVWQTWDRLRIRTWRDIARYEGIEIFNNEGAEALKHLPRVIEDVMAKWEKEKHQPQFKAEDIIQYNGVEALAQAARVTAERLKLNQKETGRLIERYVGYTRELTGPAVKPVPPLLMGMSKNSRDHNPENYGKILLPMFAAMNPPPKVSLVHLMAGVHNINKPESDLPEGIAPAVIQVWHDAITQGYFAASQ